LLLDRRRRRLERSSAPRRRMAAPIEAMLKKGQKVRFNTRGGHFYEGSNRSARSPSGHGDITNLTLQKS
jgi:hypothetical protein